MKKLGLIAFAFVAANSFGAVAEEVAKPDELPAIIEKKDDAGIFTFSFENDIVSGDDGHYTNGFRLGYLTPESYNSEILNSISSAVPFFSEHGTRRYGVALGQSMFTPRTIDTRVPDPQDRPYAGWLHADFSITSDTDRRLDYLELSLGVVGPSALAGQTQDFVHSIFDSADDPQGWDSQLGDEPAIMLSYERRWQNFWEASPFGFGADLMPHVGFSAGNVFTHAAAGVMMRIGRDLPSDYGPPVIRPSFGGSDFFRPRNDFGWYLFAGAEGRAVARNIFLDGNTFKDSPSVDKENFVGDAQVGLAFTFADYRVAYTHIFRTKEFKTQQDADSYGSINFSMRF